MTNFYRLCRVWHGYLSAAAFMWLLFFAGTGILLNHPTWLGAARPVTVDRQFRLQPSELAPIKAAKNPGAAVVDALRSKLGLSGDISSTDTLGSQIFVRMRGARGSSDLQLDLSSGQGSASTETFGAVTLFKELHRGEQAGPVWRALIDISGALLAITAIIGLLIYFSMRLRLKPALILISGGLAVMVGALLLFVN